MTAIDDPLIEGADDYSSDDGNGQHHSAPLSQNDAEVEGQQQSSECPPLNEELGPLPHPLQPPSPHHTDQVGATSFPGSGFHAERRSHGEVLQTMQKAVQAASRYNRENASLRQDLQQARLALARTRERYGETREALRKQLEATSERERDLEDLAAKLQAKLEVQAGEIQTLRERSVKPDVELLRVQEREDVEREYASKMKTLSKELESWRQKHSNIRQEYEVYKAKSQQDASNADREIKSARELREVEVSALKSSLESMVKGETCCTKSCQGKSEEVKHLQARIETMKREYLAEIKEACAARDREEIARHQFVSSHQEELADKAKQRALLEADNRILKGKNSILESDISKLSNECSELRNLLFQAEKEIPKLKGSLQDAEKKVKEANDSAKEEATIAEKTLATQIRQMNEEKESLRKKKEEAEEAAKKAQNGVIAKIREYATRETTLRKEANDELRKMKEHVLLVEEKNQHLEEQSRRSEADHVANMHRIMHECDVYRSDASRTTREKEIMAQKVVAALRNIEQLKESLEASQNDLIAANGERRDLLSKIQQAEDSNEGLLAQNNALEEELGKALNDVSRLATAAEQQKQEHQREILEFKRTTRNCKEGEQSLNLKQEVDRMKAKLAREKKKSDAYKEKAIEAHKRSILAKQALSAPSNVA